MRLIFLGTPAFAVATLEAVVKAGHEVAAVLTQPDRPRGRGQNAAGASPGEQGAVSPAFAVATLEAVVKAGHEVAAVLTQPDRPRGRGQNAAAASPVKQAAVSLGLTVYQRSEERRV